MPLEGSSTQFNEIPVIELSSNRDSLDGHQNDGPSGMHSFSEATKDDRKKTSNNIEYGNIEDLIYFDIYYKTISIRTQFRRKYFDCVYNSIEKLIKIPLSLYEFLNFYWCWNENFGSL